MTEITETAEMTAKAPTRLDETLLFADSDAMKYLTEEDREALVALHNKITTGRLEDGCHNVYGVFVPTTHRHFDMIETLVDRAEQRDVPLVIDVRCPWYDAVAALTAAPVILTPVPGHQADVQRSVVALADMRQRYARMLKSIGEALYRDSATVSAIMVAESDMLVQRIEAAMRGGHRDRAEQIQGQWEHYDAGFDQTVNAMQSSRERLLEANFHLERVTNTVSIIPSTPTEAE